jgi:hypothetical protein
MTKSNKIRKTKEITILKGLQKICLAGILLGGSFVVAGNSEKDKKSTGIGMGIAGISALGGIYVINRRLSIEYPDYVAHLNKKERCSTDNNNYNNKQDNNYNK